MTTDALAALLREAMAAEGDPRPYVNGYDRQAGWLRARGVVVLPPDHPLRTGEPSPEMIRAAGIGFSNLEVSNRNALKAALRAALVVLRTP